jgi:hypothetical protein
VFREVEQTESRSKDVFTRPAGVNEWMTKNFRDRLERWSLKRVVECNFSSSGWLRSKGFASSQLQSRVEGDVGDVSKAATRIYNGNTEAAGLPALDGIGLIRAWSSRCDQKKEWRLMGCIKVHRHVTMTFLSPLSFPSFQRPLPLRTLCPSRKPPAYRRVFGVAVARECKFKLWQKAGSDGYAGMFS